MSFLQAQSGARISTEEVRVRKFRVISSKPFDDGLKDLMATIGRPEMSGFLKAASMDFQTADTEKLKAPRKREATAQTSDRTANDRTVHPELERFCAKRMGAKTYELDSSHVLMLSKPKLVLDLIRKGAPERPGRRPRRCV